jgi:hypothetical protein
MKTTKTLLGLALLVLCIPAAAQVHVLTDTNGVLRAPPEFFSRNTNALVSALQAAGYSPSGTNNVQKTGGQTMEGPLWLLHPEGGLGHIAFGNAWSNLLTMTYDGIFFEIGDGSQGTPGVNNPWLMVTEGDVADWYIPVRVPSIFIGGTNAFDIFLQKSGGIVKRLEIIDTGGVGYLSIGSTNNPAAPLVAMTYDGNLFEFGDGFPEGVAVNNPWLTIADGGIATWTIPLVAPSFTAGGTNLLDEINSKQAASAALTTLASGEGGGLTAANPATNATQFVTLAQLQQSSSGGQASYFDLSKPANGFGGFTSATTNRNSLLQVSTVTTNPAVALVAGDYAAFFISTNTYSSISDGLAVVTLYCFEASAGSPTIKPDVYLINADTLQVEHEYEPSPSYQTVPGTLGGLVFSVPVTDRATGTNVYVAVGVKLGANGTVRLVTGGAYNSHVTFPIPNTLMVMKAGDVMTGPLTLSATEAPGTSNKVAASTEFVAKAVYGATSGATGNADTNAPNAWSQPQAFNGGISAPGTNNLGVIHVTGIESDNAIDQSIGGTGGTDAESARAALGLAYDVNILQFYLSLKQIAQAMISEGHMPYLGAAGMTNTPSLAFGRSVLNTADAAAVRSLIGAVYGAGDTMSGPLMVPYIGIVAGHTNIGSNQVATIRAVAEVEQRVSVGGFISSVSNDFEVVGGQLRFTNTTGDGPVLRATAAGTNTQISGLSDVTISTPVAGQMLVYDGSRWRNSPMSRMETADQWVEHFTGIFGGAANEAIALDEWTATTISGGTKALAGTYAGRNGVWQASGAPAAISGGDAIYHNGAILVPTNTMHFRTEVILVLTNSLMVRAGYNDTGTSTNLPTDAFHLVLTNGVLVGEACQGGFANRTQTTTSFQCSSNVWYVWRVFATNSVAWFRVYTNRTQLAWEDSVASNMPNNTQLVGVGITAISNGSDSTNKMLIGVDTIGHGYSVQ